MSPRRYVSANGRKAAARTVERILDAAAELVAEDAFHTATIDDLASRAGVSRATVFTRFGSKVGVLEALSTRCASGPEMRAIREAQAVADPVDQLNALLDAGCDLWEQQGYILVQLKAIVVLEPEASALIDEQRADQRAGMEALARAFSKAGLLRDGLTQQTTAATLHALTSVETFLALRRDYRLPLTTVKGTIRELAHSLLANNPE
jgi:AcrR family transcriptional regulator